MLFEASGRPTNIKQNTFVPPRCCSYTCQHEYYTCGSAGFAYIDPSASCVGDDDITADMVEKPGLRYLGDGRCHQENNREECGTSAIPGI